MGRRIFVATRGVAAGMALVMFAGAAACGDDVGPAADGGSSGDATAGTDEGSETGEPETEAAEFALTLESDGALVLTKDDAALLTFPPDAFRLGVVDEVDEGANYDPMHDLAVTWVSPSAVTPASGGTVSATLQYEGGPTTTLRIDEVAPGRFTASWVPEQSAPAVAVMRLRLQVDESEGLYGLGEWFDHPNHRGRDRPMQIEADLSMETGNNEVHVPIPLLIGTTGWGLFVEDPHPGRFECATEADDIVQVSFGVGPDGGDGLRFHILAAEHPLDVTKHYYALTGKPATPSRWAIGPWLWRNENIDQAQVQSDANMLRDLDLACSALWVDRPYASGVNAFDFDPGRYPDPQGMIDELHSLGLRFALWHTPYVSNEDEPVPELNAHAVDSGYLPPVTGPHFNPWGKPLDFTNRDARDWWQELLARYADMGVEGYKLDYGEDVVPGLGGARVPWEFADGRTDRVMQSQYQREYHSTYAEMLPADGGFILARAGTYGDQVDSTVIWPGDLDADFTTYRQLVDGEFRVGGLPAAVAAGSSLGPSGYPLFASDTGGYRHSPPDKEVFTRWFQHTTFTPVMQIGTASSDVAWEGDEENGFDEEMLAQYRELTRLHLRLFPYLWTHVERVRRDGRPIVRALGLAYPELGEHPAYDYLLGDDIFVAPVVERGATTRELVLPPGRWMDWFSGEMLEGPGRMTVDAPLDKVPAYLREGGIIPMLRPTIDSLSPTDQPDRVDSYDTDPGVLWARVVPGEGSWFELFDGTFLAQQRVAPQSGAVWGFDYVPGEELSQGVVVEARMDTAPREVTLDGDPVPEVSDPAGASTPGWTFTEDRGGTLVVRIPAGPHSLVTLE